MDDVNFNLRELCPEFFERIKNERKIDVFVVLGAGEKIYSSLIFFSKRGKKGIDKEHDAIMYTPPHFLEDHTEVDMLYKIRMRKKIRERKIEGKLHPKRYVLIIEDSWKRGATMKHVFNMLKDAGYDEDKIYVFFAFGSLSFARKYDGKSVMVPIKKFFKEMLGR